MNWVKGLKLKSLRAEDGTILLFGIGLAVAGLMVLTASVNVAALWSTRNYLDGIADGAALAGAQAVDANSIYVNGLESKLVLSDPLARIRVEQYVIESGARKQVSNFKVKSVRVTGRSITVTVQAQPKLPFGYLLPESHPLVASAAKAINKVQ
jgi:hypothetical protein